MERPYSSNQVNELFEIIDNTFSALIRDYGHRDEGYCLACDNEPFEALDELRHRFGQRPDWPKEVHEQYLRLLDERDHLQAKIDILESRYEH